MSIMFPELEYHIPKSWDDLPTISQRHHDPKFLRILEDYGFGRLRSPVPLQRRYTKGRRWTDEEFETCFRAWKEGSSLTLIAAALNRNPQDMIYKLLDRCKIEGIQFTEKGRSDGSRNWTPDVKMCAERLFEAGLPAWKIAALFRVDFEYVEKAVFLGRSDYGHKKRNPFTICSDHKQLINQHVLGISDVKIKMALDAFAGEGSLTMLLEQLFPSANILALESDPETFARAQQRKWNHKTYWKNVDNLEEIDAMALEGKEFDFADLDPFVTCHKQIPKIWQLLKPEALLFVTFGGEYRRSFIRSNRKAIAERYGFSNPDLDNREYLTVVPEFFLGWVALQAVGNGFMFDVIRAVRYPNNCRFWLRARSIGISQAPEWFEQIAERESGGWQFRGLVLPRFKEVRHELEQQNQGRLFE